MIEKKYNLLVISDFDSRVKWGVSLARHFHDYCNVSVFYKEVPQDVYARYLAPYSDVKEYHIIHDIPFDKFDIIIIALGGTCLLHTLHMIKEKHPCRAVLITGFNGLTAPYDPHGMLCRYGSDIICVNARPEYVSFKQALEAMHLDSSAIQLSGYLRLNNRQQQRSKPPSSKKTLLFVEQVNKPPLKIQKIFLIRKLHAYALAHPEKQVLIKTRDTGKVKHTNSGNESHVFLNLWKLFVPHSPDNVSFIEKSIEDVIPDIDVCVSFSSTVLFEALHANKKAVVINDFGIGKAIDNQVFIGSNLFCSLDDIIQDKIPQVDKDWLRDNCFFSDDHVREIVNNSLERLRAIRKGDITAPNMFYTSKNFPYFYTKDKEKGSIVTKIIAIYKKIMT